MPPHRRSYRGALDAGQGLLGWAQLAVDGLHWLVDVDDYAFEGDRRNLKGHGEVAVDMAHARWATMTATTAVDLCAAELGGRYAPADFWGSRLADIEDLRPKNLRRRQRERGVDFKLPDLARDWVSQVLGDRNYQIVKEARDPFAHALHVRIASLRSSPALATTTGPSSACAAGSMTPGR